MSYFDSKVQDYFSSYGKLVSLPKSCKCGKVQSSSPMPNVVEVCGDCGIHLHTCYVK